MIIVLLEKKPNSQNTYGNKIKLYTMLETSTAIRATLETIHKYNKHYNINNKMSRIFIKEYKMTI